MFYGFHTQSSIGSPSSSDQGSARVNIDPFFPRGGLESSSACYNCIMLSWILSSCPSTMDFMLEMVAVVSREFGRGMLFIMV